MDCDRHGNVIGGLACLAFVVAVLLAPPAASSPGGAHSSGYVAGLKAQLRSQAAEPLAENAFRAAPLFTWVAGWDFSMQQWRLNEFTNQLIHMLVGGLLNKLAGRPFTLVVAVGVEFWQFAANDDGDPRLLDRARDVAFYLLV